MYEKATVTQYIQDSLFKNSMFIMLNSTFSAILGFAYITIITNQYAPSDIGYFSAVMSAVGILTLFSKAGLDVGLIRYLPQSKEPINLINSCFTVCGLLAMFFSLVFLAGVSIWSPAIKFISENINFILLFVTICIFAVASSVQMNVFVGLRSTKYLVIRDLINNVVKTLFIILVTDFGLTGLLSANIIGLIISFFIALLLIRRVEHRYIPRLEMDTGIIKNIASFSGANFIASLLGTGSSLALPLMIVNALGAEEAAHFYVAWTISNFIMVISGSVSTSLFAEGSKNQNEVYSHARKSLKLNYILLVPTILCTIVFGKEILLIFGSKYSQGAYPLLTFLVLSTLLSSFNEIVYNINLVEKNTKFTIIFTGISGFGTLLISYLLIGNVGIVGVGLGRVLSNGMLSLVLLQMGYSKKIMG